MSNEKDSTNIPFAGCFTPGPSQESSLLVFVGLPEDSQSSYCSGCAEGPQQIRSSFNGSAYNSTTESGIDLAEKVTDLGDLKSQPTWKQTAKDYQEFVESIFRKNQIPFFAGGDHAVTIPILKALAVLLEPVHVIQIDAHPDLYPEYNGDDNSHACVAARALEMEHIVSITQIGIRTLNSIQEQVSNQHKDRLTIIQAKDCKNSLEIESISKEAPVYITVDMDGFDPAFAPGVSHPVPGGLTARQVFNFIQNGHWNLVGMDVVELNPRFDVRNQTAILAAKILHEAMGTVFQKKNSKT